jgi:putative spermidine/putrescine transport system substrate-binding protein
MPSRRSFLVGASSIALSQFLFGCSDREETLKIFFLQRSIPSQSIGEFERQILDGKRVDFHSESQLKTLFNLLESWQKPTQENQNAGNEMSLFSKTPDRGDLVSLSDYWLSEAIEKQLIQPLNLDRSDRWQKIPTIWQQLVRRNTQGDLDPNGKIWGAPYRSGMTLIVYDRDKFTEFDWKPQDWSDLWRKELKGRISLLNNPREVIGLTLKKLGHSYNTQNLSEIADLKPQLAALHQQTKFYDDKDYLQPLILEDTWLAVGWSSDIIPLLAKHRNLQAAVPASGTSLWADLWVRPKQVQNQQKAENKAAGDDFIAQWIDFCWQTKQASEISLFGHGVSPIDLGKNRQELPASLQKNPLLAADSKTIDRSEFLQPFNKSTTETYLNLWQKIRTASIKQ